MDTNASGIYAIISPSGKRYVGQSVNIKQRWAGHRHDLKRGKHACRALQRAYNKYGENGLQYIVLELCVADREIITQREQLHMDATPVGMLYNSAPAAGSAYGFKHTAETRMKIRLARLGTVASADTRAKMSAARKGMRLGEARSEEHRLKIAKSLTGFKHSAEARANMSSSKIGRVVSEGTRAKIAASNTGKIQSEDVLRKLSIKRVGRRNKNNTSGFPGVCFIKRGGKWQASRDILRKTVHLGTYPTAELASQARQNFDRILDYYSHS